MAKNNVHISQEERNTDLKGQELLVYVCILPPYVPDFINSAGIHNILKYNE
jgi:hypothetical protein